MTDASAAASDAVDAVKDAAEKAGDATKDAAAKATDAAEDAAAKASDATKDTAAKVSDATKDAAAKATDATKDAAAKATDATKDAKAATQDAVAKATDGEVVTGKVAPPPRSMDEIESELTDTRARLASRIDDLQDYVRPKNVMQRQVDKAKGMFVDEYGGVRPDRVAIAAGVAAAFVGLVVLRRRRRRS